MLPIVQKFYKEVVHDMNNNKLDTITNLFEEKEIRSKSLVNTNTV